MITSKRGVNIEAMGDISMSGFPAFFLQKTSNSEKKCRKLAVESGAFVSRIQSFNLFLERNDNK